MTVNVRKDASGNRVGYEGFIKDIFDRKRMEEELKKSEERYRTILENIQEVYYEMDLAGIFTFVNDTICRDVRYSREELIGMNYWQYEDEETRIKLKALHPGDVRLTLESFKEGKIRNHLSVVNDGSRPWLSCAGKGPILKPLSRTLFYSTLTSSRRMVAMCLPRSKGMNI